MIDVSFLSKPVKNTAILMRHADREHIVPGVNEDEPINEAGRINSVKLGEKLSPFFDSVKIFSSPIDRCVQTGEAVIRGLQKPGGISTSDMLGEPGPFVFDRKAGARIFNELGCKGTVESMIAGEKLTGIRSAAEGSENLAEFILSKMRTNAKENLLLFITHDAIVIPLIHHYTGEKFGRERWIDFADGVIFVEEDDGVRLVWNGKKYAIR